MSSNSRTEVSAELGLGLAGPEHTIVPLMASLSYSCHDPYAVTIAFHVGTDEPVEWTLARDLLAAALHSREGSRGLPGPDHQVVPDGTESDHIDFDAELTSLLSQA